MNKHITKKERTVIYALDHSEWRVCFTVNQEWLCGCGPVNRAILRAVRGKGKATCLGGAVKIAATCTGKKSKAAEAAKEGKA